MRFLQVLGVSVALMVLIAVASASAPVPETHRASTYFPVGSLRANADADAEQNAWLTSALEGMRGQTLAWRTPQPSLFTPSLALKEQQPDEAYRAVISSGHEYVMVILAFRNSKGSFLHANELDFRADHPRQRAEIRALTSGEWNKITQAMESVNFASVVPPPATGGDCPSFAFEERKGTEYHLESVGCAGGPSAARYAPLIKAYEDVSGWYPY